MSTQNIYILRTAKELWELAGPDMWLYGWTENHCAMLQGRIERCVMAADEFAEYQRMRRRWQEAGQDLASQDLASQDLAGAPSVSMLVVESEEQMKLEAVRLRPVSHFARAFNVMEAMLLAHARSLDEEDREEMLRRLAGQMMSLKEAVLRAEEIWREEGGETGRQGDLEAMELEEFEQWHREELQACVDELMQGVPGSAMLTVREVRNLLRMAWLDGGASERLSPAQKTQQVEGGAA